MVVDNPNIPIPPPRLSETQPGSKEVKMVAEAYLDFEHKLIEVSQSLAVIVATLEAEADSLANLERADNIPLWGLVNIVRCMREDIRATISKKRVSAETLSDLLQSSEITTREIK